MSVKNADATDMPPLWGYHNCQSFSTDMPPLWGWNVSLALGLITECKNEVERSETHFLQKECKHGVERSETEFLR